MKEMNGGNIPRKRDKGNKMINIHNITAEFLNLFTVLNSNLFILYSFVFTQALHFPFKIASSTNYIDNKTQIFSDIRIWTKTELLLLNKINTVS